MSAVVRAYIEALASKPPEWLQLTRFYLVPLCSSAPPPSLGAPCAQLLAPGSPAPAVPLQQPTSQAQASAQASAQTRPQTPPTLVAPASAPAAAPPTQTSNSNSIAAPSGQLPAGASPAPPLQQPQPQHQQQQQQFAHQSAAAARYVGAIDRVYGALFCHARWRELVSRACVQLGARLRFRFKRSSSFSERILANDSPYMTH